MQPTRLPTQYNKFGMRVIETNDTIKASRALGAGCRALGAGPSPPPRFWLFFA